MLTELAASVTEDMAEEKSLLMVDVPSSAVAKRLSEGGRADAVPGFPA